MYLLMPFFPRLLLLVLAAILCAHGMTWLPIVIVAMVVWGRGLPRVL